MKQRIPKPILLPRTKTTTRKPVPYPRTKITLCKEALEKCIKSFNVNIKNNKDPLFQLTNTVLFIEIFIKNRLKKKRFEV